ncbi:hypothetical protein GYMLUDRAFT_250227 [Collybiopsis luxurians FD-317 M1]|uniref:Uncharacterized protein n=1 Tax=Collybiopsis luxurians FD-317 M1 TaxID=944289 RepID=A0A0D0C6Y7_9AGAR|nr:hypothetical protein GYMLUDRAFT_250227 [Collybiopsis luxurians FD-317 M1]
MASPSPFDSALFLDHLADAAESISQVISDQDILVNQARCEFGQLQRVVEGQSNEIHKLRELLSQTMQEFEDKMLELSRVAQEARYLHETAEVTIKEQDRVIKELRDSLVESHNLQLAAETLAGGHLQEALSSLEYWRSALGTSNYYTIAPMDVWGGPSSESFPFEMKSDSTPNSLSNFIPSLDTTSLPSTLVETCNTSPVVIFSSGHPNAYFVRTGEDPLTYSLVKKNEDELADPSLHMALSLQDIWEQMEIERVEDLYARELEEVFGIPLDVRAEHDKLSESSFD